MDTAPSPDEPGLSDAQRARVLDLARDLARNGNTDELAEFLDHGVPVDLADSEGNSLLMLAAYSGRADTCRMLIARGADVDRRNARDQAIVAGALFKGAEDVVALLVAAGADLDTGTPSARAAAQMFGREHLLPAPDGT